MGKETKELVLRLPDKLFEVIKNFKDMSGISYTNFIYNAIMWYCITKGLIDINTLKGDKGE